tara:strand:+ start:345 stop:1196 length:852 start_codon:yes stop_codon:yes gene_type:complete
MKVNVLPSYTETLDLARLTMLVYEYGKSFEIDGNQTIEKFLTESMENKIDMNETRKEAIKTLSESSPHGQVVKFVSDPKTDIQVGITISQVNKRITIVFRGSESKYDWYYDLSIMKKQLWDNVYVHSGFYNQLHINNVYEELVKTVKELLEKNPEFHVCVTGHSLGAALSTLFGYELSHEIDKKIMVVSFASPRVGNSEFKETFDLKENLVHYRVSNDRDIVTAAPMLFFHHVGVNISLTDSLIEVFYNYDYNGWWRYSLFNCWRVSDHDMDLYYKRLLKHPW